MVRIMHKRRQGDQDEESRRDKPPQLAGVELVSMSSEFIRRISVIRVEQMKDLSSPRFGPICHGQMCGVCNNYYTMCAGHSGHMDLHYPVLHPEFRQKHAAKVLRILCPWCQRLVVETNRGLWKTYQAKLLFHDSPTLAPKNRLTYMDKK